MAYRDNSNSCGCGCLMCIVLVLALLVNECKESSSSNSSTSTSTQNTESNYSPYQNSSVSQDYSVSDELSEEDKQYEYNSLATGATPYSIYYGKNYKCPYEQCSGIKVTAPSESDIVVIIKKNNADGKVISHGYIKAGATLFLSIPDGTYQTFFYYGAGWNPNKDMGNGIKGGFVKDEVYSKDNPRAINNGILVYVLQLQRDGNFQTKGSNRREIF